MKIQNFDRQLKNLQDYGLSFQSAINILEIVGAFDKEVPHGTASAVQVIADMHDVNFIYHQRATPKRAAKCVLTGIFNDIRSTFLYYDDRKVSKFCKNATQFMLRPGADNLLEKIY